MTAIGFQSMMLKKEFTEEGVFETLQKVAKIGYRSVEVSQIEMSEDNVAALERAKDELGIRVGALSAALRGPNTVPVDTLEESFDKIVSDCRRLDCQFIRMGMIPLPMLASKDTAVDFATRCNEYAQRLSDLGLTLLYHNHNFEFIHFDGRILLDIMLDAAPAMGLELDIHWAHRGGVDPEVALAKYLKRVGALHLKDYRIAPIPADIVAGKGTYQRIHDAFSEVVEFAEVGEGNLNMRGVIDAAVAADIPYMFVEQDDTYDRTSLEALELSYRNLQAMGYGALLS